MKWNRRMIPIAAAAVVLGIVALYSLRWRERDVGRSIKLSGNIELAQANLSFRIPGRLVERQVDEGDPVEKGMVLARLDQEQLLRQRDRARAALAVAESQLPQLLTTIQYQGETTSAQIEQRRAELNQAEARLRDLLAGARSLEIEQAKGVVERARTEYEWAKGDWERAQVLYKNEDISTAQSDQIKTRFQSSLAALKQAEAQLGLVMEGPRREIIVAARAEVERARAGLRSAESNRLEVRRRQQEIETRRAEIDRARADLALVETQLQDAEAKSPMAGVVLVKAAEVGEILAAGTPVVTVGDIDHPWLRGYVGEQDLGRVKLGAKVKVTTDSFPGKIYWGRVSFIASEAEFTPKQIQTPEERIKLVYRIKIDIANPERELKLNMPADAEVVL